MLSELKEKSPSTQEAPNGTLARIIDFFDTSCRKNQLNDSQCFPLSSSPFLCKSFFLLNDAQAEGNKSNITRSDTSPVKSFL